MPSIANTIGRQAMRPKPRKGYHYGYHSHPGVEGHDHEHPLVGHHVAPYAKVIHVPDATDPSGEPDYTLLLKRSIENEEAKRRDAG